MPRWKDSWRVLPLIAVGGAIVLLLTGVGMGLYNEQLYRTQRAREVAVQAEIVAASVAAALAFDDDRAAQEYVNALRANPQIDAAGVYDERGRLAASFDRAGPFPATQPRTPTGPVFEHGRVTVAVNVSQGSTHLGAVFLRTRPEALGALLARHAGVTLLAIMAFFFALVLGLAQATLRRTNTELEDRAHDLAEANGLLQVQMEEREKAEEALRQSQKMEAIGQLTGGVAHDFNNILMVASSGLDLLDRTADPDRRQMLKDGIRQAVDRGASLTRQLLTISRRSTLQPEVIDVRERIEGMRVLLDRSLRENITVGLALQRPLWNVEVDPSQLEVALLNIAVNARDAMPAGGSITISARNAPGMAEGDLKGDYVRLAVTDEGSGMPPEMTRRIFEPFFTTKGVGKGTGLGLSQVYGFAHASGGAVLVDSEVDKGTTISIYLPRSMKTLSDRPDPAAHDIATPRGQGRILLVEDEDSVAALVSEMLRELGYEPMHAPSAAIALRMLEADANPDLVLSDMVMPGRMNGIELAREIARRRPELPVVLTTGFSEAAQQAQDEGLRLLAKPYRMDTLAEVLAAARRDARPAA